MTVQVNDENGLMQFITLIGKGARLSIWPLLLLICCSVIVVIASVSYSYWGAGISLAWSLLPVYLFILPLSGLLFYWFALDGISRLPDTLLESKELLYVLRERYAKRRKKTRIVGLGFIATIRRAFLLAGLLWDSRDVIDAASNVYSLVDLVNPVFWLAILVSTILSVLLCVVSIVCCLGHYFFS